MPLHPWREPPSTTTSSQCVSFWRCAHFVCTEPPLFLAAQAWGVLVALATPDTRDQVYAFEYPHFFVTHALELLVPLYYLARRRYAVHTSLTSTLFYFACFILLHFGVYEVVSIASEQNLNYIMMPPRPLHKFGKSFRYIAVAAGAATTLLFRHIVVTGVLACIKALAPSPSAKAKTA